MIEEYTYSDILTYLIESYGLVIDLPEKGLYYVIKDDLTEVEHVCWSPNPVNVFDEIYSVGLELVRKLRNKVIIQPTVMNFDTTSPRIEVSSMSLLRDVTKGKSISFNKLANFEGEVVILIHNNIPIAYGTVNEGEFSPLTDIGIYLREGE